MSGGSPAARAPAPRHPTPRPPREGERIFFPGGVVLRVAIFDFPPGETFPRAVTDLAQTFTDDRLDAACTGDDSRRVHAARQWARVDRRNPVVLQPIAEPRGLASAFVGQLRADFPGEPVLRGHLGGAVANEIKASRAHRVRSSAAAEAIPLSL